MRALTAKEIHEKRKREDIEWENKNAGLRRMYATLLEKIRISKLNLDGEKEREVQKFLEFQADMQRKREKLMIECEEWKDKLERMQDIIDGMQLRQDALDEREHLLGERKRNLDERERMILSAERQLNKMEQYVNVHG